MHLGSPIRVDATKILSRRELAAVLADPAGQNGAGPVLFLCRAGFAREMPC
ncbi:MAG TPA: hypothetical protein VGM05_18860 [Planctomycetaceae bacterium]